MHKVYFSIGTNLDERDKNLCNAREMLQKDVGNITAASSVYRTEPWGFAHKNYFLNQVLEIQSELDAFHILEKIQLIEKQVGRNHQAGSYTARIIDIDILFYDDLIIETDVLKIPHPLITERLFVLVPLEEIIPVFIHPVHRLSIRQLLTSCTDQHAVLKINDSLNL